MQTKIWLKASVVVALLLLGPMFSNSDMNLHRESIIKICVNEAASCRSQHQLAFHSAFERSTARVIYREDWGTQRPNIMRKNAWKTCPSEVLIRCSQKSHLPAPPSTVVQVLLTHAIVFVLFAALRVDSGKLFRALSLEPTSQSPSLKSVISAHRIAIFAACLALSFKLELVVFR